MRSSRDSFVPGPLPPPLDLDRALVLRIAEAERSLGRLAGFLSTEPGPRLPIRAFMCREGILSSRLEGTETTFTDLLRFEAAPSARGDVADAREVANYVRALEFAVAPERHSPVSLGLIRDMHRILTRGSRQRHVMPGEFRKARTPPGAPACMTVHAVLAPPPAREMRVALRALERHLHEASDLPPLVRLALVHGQFQMIQPFLHGNGRVGRLLVSRLLREWGLLGPPVLSLSAHFERHRQEHNDLLLAAGQTGAWEAWVRFFLEGVTDQSRDALRRLLRVRDLRDEYLVRLRRARSRTPHLGFVEGVFQSPAVTIPGAARLLKVTQRAAASVVGRLVDSGILSEARGGDRGRIFLAHEIIRAVEDDA